MSGIVMFDAVDLSQFPSNPQAVAGYVGGHWPTFSPLVKKFPNAHHLSIAVSASEDADCLDIERGDAVPAQAPGWVLRQQHRGIRRPVVYSSISDGSAVLDALRKGGVARSEVRVWTAHYTFVSHIESGSDGTQWTDHALGRNLDESLLISSFFSLEVNRVPIKHVNKLQYNKFQRGPFKIKDGIVSELGIVQGYDQLRRHPLIHHTRLKQLEEVCAELAGRVYQAVFNDPNDDGSPGWGKYYRGWRFQQLCHRSQGMRFA